MTEAEFEDIHQRYLDGTSRPGEQELIEQWNRQLGTPENLILPHAEHEQVRAAMWHQIKRLTRGDRSDTAANIGHRTLRPPSPFWHKPVVRWAATVWLLVGATLVVILPRQRKLASPTRTSVASWVQQRNTGQQIQLITLADSSRVSLYPGSSLHYRPGLVGTRREVKLQGEAFFQVAKNSTRPFLVYTEQLVTTVLGTSFRVKAYTGRTNEVAVQEGRVSVQIRRGADVSASPAKPAAKGLLLLPNQQVAYSAASARLLRKQLVENPVVLVPQEFTFENQPVVKVLQALEKAYGVDILFDKNKLTGCTITITFYQESLYEKLDVLSKALGASYSATTNAQIQFFSNGCAL